MIEPAPALATNNPLYRNQDRVMKDDPETATDLFERLRASLPETIGQFKLIGLNECVRFYRYRPGQEFAPHMDHWYRPKANQITLHTILVYFNDVIYEAADEIGDVTIDRIMWRPFGNERITAERRWASIIPIKRARNDFGERFSSC